MSDFFQYLDKFYGTSDRREDLTMTSLFEMLDRFYGISVLAILDQLLYDKPIPAAMESEIYSYMEAVTDQLQRLTRAANTQVNKGKRLSEWEFRRTLTIKHPIFQLAPQPELHWQIVYELRLIIDRNSSKVTIHGLWLGYLDYIGVVHFILHKKYSRVDSVEATQVIQEAQQQLSSLDGATKDDMKTMWPNLKGPDDEMFHIHEFMRHAFTPTTYKSKYFEDAISAAKPYIGGGKDLQKFLEGYVAGKVYEWDIFSSELQNHMGVPVRILCSKSGKASDRVLREIGIIFSQDMDLIPYPGQIFDEVYLKVKP